MRHSDERLGPWARGVQLVVLMLLGAGAGLLCAPILVQKIYLYDHGFGETERAMLVTAPVGALVGACVHALIEKLDR